MKTLVLAEKPSVARELARVLGCGHKHKHYMEGPQYVVTWALGHLVELSEPEDYDAKYRTWNIDDLPLLPEKMDIKVIKETSHQYKAIAQLGKRADLGELVIATDAGREGELVARWIMELMRWRKPFKRLWISSQTDKAIRDGFRQLKPGRDYDRLYASAVCRAEADWLIGLNVTRALTCKYDAPLSAGRVQTPTLGMVMEREKDIQQFQSKPYWTVHADCGSFQALWREKEGHDGRLWDKAQAEELVAQMRRSELTVQAVKTSSAEEPHPLPYDLTELQRDANRRLGFSAKQTSNVLQRLYEQHKLVTYPRTDSRYLSSDLVPTFKARLERVAVGPYSGAAKKAASGPIKASKRFVDDAKVSDHHAIIPTDEYVNLSALSPEERRLYDLIVRRFIALFYPSYRYDKTSLTLTGEGRLFFAHGRTDRDPGWREVYGASVGDGDDEDEDESAQREPEQRLPQLRVGQKLALRGCSLREQRTQPPPRYTEATLLTRMEQHNLGTPATRADIIEKLLASETLERSRNRLVPTGKGKQLIELVADELRQPELTARWEQELERIARGQGDRGRFMADIRAQALRLVQQVKRDNKVYTPHNLTGSKCPECGKPLLEVKGKRGRSLVCADRECGYRRATEAAVINKRCPQCRKKMVLQTGKAGKYAQCKPCNVIEMLDGDNGGGRTNRRAQEKLAKQFSDNVTLGSSLGDALKAALAKQNDE